jgi:hypothetical protein
METEDEKSERKRWLVVTWGLAVLGWLTLEAIPSSIMQLPSKARLMVVPLLWHMQYYSTVQVPYGEVYTP